jgi:hypothetical protein
MSKQPPDRDPNLRQSLARPEEDQVAELQAMTGEPSQALVPRKPAVPKKKAPKTRAQTRADFCHPEDRPDVDDMFADLVSAHIERGFGYGFESSCRVAARLECELYNNWVTLQCLQKNQRHPGTLSVHAYVERFWTVNCGGYAE